MEPSLSLTRLSDVRTLVTRLGFHPSRALGQNFLVDGNILDILLAHADVSRGDRILEIGPGLGVVTEALLKLGARVTAVEKDHRLYAYLAGELEGCDGLTLQQGDVLEVGIPGLLESGVDKLVSNLPYSPGSRILLDVVRDDHAPAEIIVTVQLEVAQRITAGPGTKAFGLIGVWCQLHYDVSLVKVISPNCFWPRPDVKSAIVTLQRRTKPRLAKTLESRFYALTRYAFQQRRKQLASTLSKAPAELACDAERCRELLQQIGASADARPEALSIEQWRLLTEAMAASS